MSPDTPALLENRTYDELSVGDSASLVRTLNKDDIALFAILSGDVNPAHLDEAYARDTPFHKVIAHGMWGGTLISTVLGTKLPGPGTIYVGQTLQFMRPVGLGDRITVTVTVKAKEANNRVRLDCLCTNQLGKPVISGEAEVLAPQTKVSRPPSSLPDVHLHRHERFDQLMSLVQSHTPLRCAVVWPDDEHALTAALECAQAGLLTPVLVGNGGRIRALAAQLQLDLNHCEIEEAPGPAAAAHHAIALAREGDVLAVMQGALPVGTLMHAVMDHGYGLRTHRRVSHAYIADVPAYPRPFIVTDAAINIQPTLEDKRDIVQNAIDLARTLGLSEPRVAILSAAETVHSTLSSSMDAAALCKMLERHQIAGGIVDGPLSLDAAINERIARLKHPQSPVAGQANVLVVPNLETGDMLVKQLSLLADADVAGIVLGTRVPIILTNPADSPRTRLASAALALLLHDADGRLSTEHPIT
ncbi:MAG: bifunctional enoyl-CoA hydratase/phosphate acetyltransferase [Aquabacterium sp.]